MTQLRVTRLGSHRLLDKNGAVVSTHSDTDEALESTDGHGNASW